ncbi:MAG: phage tail tube protein [Schlesneria sp.]
MATKRIAKGTVLQLSIASVFTTVALCKKIDFPDDETEFYDGTALDSTDKEDGTPTGFGVPGSLSADLFYDPLDSVHQKLLTSRAAKTVETWQITNPNIGATTHLICSFTGAIKKFKPTAAVSAGLEASLDVKLATCSTYNTPA